ncbi:MAG: hypothetical protein IJH34_04535 [Romboutsia sp.]|nr:hypothetical protein [Romboutsia sp.]
MAAGLKIPVSFKKTEMDLYNYVKGKRNPSCYIKDLIEKDMKSNNGNNVDSNPIGKNNDSNNDLGFDF